MRRIGPVIVSAASALMVLLPATCLSQYGPGAAPSQPASFGHELTLIAIGAVLGGLLGPVFQMIDNAIGITPGAKQQRANYQVQREIAKSLRELVKSQRQKSADTSAPDDT